MSAGKLARIQQLDAHGLNTPRIFLIEVGTAFDAALRRRLLEVAGGDARMTVRTYHPTDEIAFAKGPFAPEIPVDDAIVRAEEFSREWNVLFQEAIDVRETELAGNIALSSDGSGHYEALAGQYRVREVEDPPPGAEAALRVGTFTRAGEIPEPGIRDAVARVLESSLFDEIDERVVLEFNVQSRPVGRRHEPLLFWEWRALPGSGPALEERLGGKGAGLMRASAAGLPVPAFAVLPAAPSASTELPEAWRREIGPALMQLTNGSHPRRLAVRSSPTVSMPGMLDTVLDVDPFPDDVERGLRAVLASWASERAQEYRRAHRIPDDAGLAVVLQRMVAATADGLSGGGVGFTRDPVTGADGPQIEFVEHEPGVELVSGAAVPLPTAEIKSRWPEAFAEIASWCPVLEDIGSDMQEFEFAIEDGRAFLLQTRPAKRTPAAALRAARDLHERGVIGLREAAALVDHAGADALLVRRLHTAGAARIGTGRVASPGVAVGRAAFDRTGAERVLRNGDAVVLLAPVPTPNDYPLLRRATGIVSTRGGVTSHASVLALDAGIVAVVGCSELTVEPERRSARFGATVVGEGDWLSIEARERGEVFLGRLAETVPRMPPDVSPELVSWARELARSR